MKKLVLIFSLILMSAIGYLNAQVIEDFETIPLNMMLGGDDDLSTMEVVANPDQSGINTSATVVKFLRDMNGVPWGGFWSALPTPVDLTTNKYVHVKIWKPRISPIKFKVENGPSANLEILSMTPQALTGQWEDMVFDFSEKTGNWNGVVFMPDFEDPVTLTEDIVIYFDDIIVNNDPTPGSAADYIIENCEHIPINLMLGGADDLSTMTVVANPDPAGINPSATVMEFFRDKDGVPWGGFWSALPVPIDITTNKYFHVKVWKPRISPIKFKVEKTGENHEVFSMNDQTLTDQWQDMVFDFSEYTGEWSIIAFLPDFEDPLTLTEDITIYFDDVRLTNDPNPMSLTNVTFSVDMTDADPFDPATDDIYLSGSFVNWPQPGTNPDLKFTPTTENPMIYTLTHEFTDPGAIYYKYFRVISGAASWDNGEWTGDPNRKVIITGETTLNDIWADKPVTVTFNVDMTDADPFDPTMDDVYIAGDLANGWAQPGTIADYMLVPTVENDMIYTISLLLYKKDYSYKYFRIIDGMASWDNGEWTGDPNRAITADTTKTVDDIWGSPAGIYNHDAITFNIYPNPVNEYLTVDNLGGADKIEIFNLVGERVRTIENISTNSVIINTSDLSKGMYLITVYNKGVIQATKFMK